MTESTKSDIKIILSIAGITFAVYFAALFADFSFIDDPVYVYKNPLVINFETIRILSESYLAAYIPVTLLSYCADYLFWGTDPLGYHLTNVIFHVFNGILLYFALYRLTRSRRVSFFTAILFAIHPVQVQTVVWISERKSVVSLFFMLISFIFYMNYKERKKALLYIASFLFFILSILSKPIAVTFFLALFCYDIFIRRCRFKGAVVDKIPFVAVSLASAYVTVAAQSAMGAVKKYHGGSLYANLITIPKGVLHYFRTLIYPKGLVFYYDLVPARTVLSVSVISGIAIIAALLYIMVRNYKQNGVISFGIALFFIFLLPVSNLIPIEIIVADRYMYIPVIGLGLSLFYYLDMKLVRHKRGYVAAVAVILLALSYSTVIYSGSWLTKEGIWEDILVRTPDNTRAMNNLAELYVSADNYEKGYEFIQRALAVDSGNIRGLKNLALYKKITGDGEAALEVFKEVLRLDPQDKEIYLEMGKVYYEQGEYDDALTIMRQGFATTHEYPLDIELKYRYVLANIYVKKIMFDEAIKEFKYIIDQSEDYIDVRRRYDLLSQNVDEFNKYLELYLTSDGNSIYKEQLTLIFSKLNLNPEGERYLNSLQQ